MHRRSCRYLHGEHRASSAVVTRTNYPRRGVHQHKGCISSQPEPGLINSIPQGDITENGERANRKYVCRLVICHFSDKNHLDTIPRIPRSAVDAHNGTSCEALARAPKPAPHLATGPFTLPFSNSHLKLFPRMRVLTNERG